MKTTNDALGILVRASSQSIDPLNPSMFALSKDDVDDVLADLRELHRLESEPRCEWRPITEAQRDGRPILAADRIGHVFEARLTVDGWIDHRGERRDVDFYLANIPAIPKPVDKPTADEWAKAAIKFMSDMKLNDRASSTEMYALLERHNAASK